jgi:predicted DsbA family dithiol-disulfide isomerase
MRPVPLEVYSDYLCPWCHLADHRLARVQEEFGADVALRWKSFLLRPQPKESRNLEKFMRYTQSWMRPASEPDAPTYRVWESSEGPPTHSTPAHVAAKAAARLGDEAFASFHARLLRAYFEESRDISRLPVLSELWSDVGLPVEGLEALSDPELLRQTAAEHNEALEIGINGVPAVRVAGTDAFVVGAQPLDTYRRWIERLLAGVLDEREA